MELGEKTMLMDDKKPTDFIKDDINFLEYPIWMIDEQIYRETYTIKKERGTYELKSKEGLPTRFDKAVLYFLVSKIFKSANQVGHLKSTEIKITRYEIAKNVFLKETGLGKREYDRIMLALTRLKALTIKFEGVFYEGDCYTFRLFSLIDDVIFSKETKYLSIRLNQQYIKQLQETKYYKRINIDEYKKLKRPVAARLYEILTKTFKERELWPISVENLTEKLTIQKRKYPSQVLVLLRPAIADINKYTSLKVDFGFNLENRICIFKKMTTETPQPPETSLDNQHLLEELKTCGIGMKVAENVVQKYPSEKVEQAVVLLKQNQQKIKNVGAWLTSALEEDWTNEILFKQAITKEQIENELQKQREAEEAKVALDKLKQKHTLFIKTKVQSAFTALPEPLQEKLEEDFSRWLKTYGAGCNSVEDCRTSFLAEALIKKNERDFVSWQELDAKNSLPL